MREEYFQLHHPNFNHENTCDFSEVFWCITGTADLFGWAIFEITDAWLGQDELCQANYSLMTLWKGLKFFRAVPPSKSPKVIGLMGIHNPDMLHCFSGMTHCLWCRKVGQNKGTIIIHLRMVHYKLGLMCKKCFGCPSVSLEGHSPPWPKELPILRRGGSGWVIFIGITTCPGCTRSALPPCELGQRKSREYPVSLRSPYWG